MAPLIPPLSVPPGDMSGQRRANALLKTKAGLRPWYDITGQPVPPFVIGIAGGTASGKTYVAKQISKQLEAVPTIAILSQDSFYGERTPEEIQQAYESNYDFDSPAALDLELFAEVLADLKACRAVQIPIYDFKTHSRIDEKTYLYGPRVIVVEGILTLCDSAMRDLFDLKIFVQADPDVMLARRIQRDVRERGRDIEGVISQYLRFVKPSYENFVLPSSKHADITVPGASNAVAIDLIVTHIKTQLETRSRRLRRELSRMPSIGADLPPSVTIIPETPRRKTLMTSLRDLTTPRHDFVEAVDRLAAQISQEVFNILPHKGRKVDTVMAEDVPGLELDVEDLCGVSVLRSGALFERGLRRIFPDVALGSMLIQSDNVTGEPSLYHVQLPKFLKDRQASSKAWVLLCDSQIGTGAAALMAIRVLLDHGVSPCRIIFLTFLVAQRGGVHAIHAAFPEVRIISAAADPGLREVEIPLRSPAPIGSRRFSTSTDEAPPTPVSARRESSSLERGDRKKVWAIMPGLGNIGDRYYGTE